MYQHLQQNPNYSLSYWIRKHLNIWTNSYFNSDYQSWLSNSITYKHRYFLKRSKFQQSCLQNLLKDVWLRMTPKSGNDWMNPMANTMFNAGGWQFCDLWLAVNDHPHYLWGDDLQHHSGMPPPHSYLQVTHLCHLLLFSCFTSTHPFYRPLSAAWKKMAQQHCGEWQTREDSL